jgi:Tn3 transposase DDE domain
MLLTRKVRDELIAGQWEELLRLAGSVKRGWIVPSVLLTRMHADPRPDRLAKALREYGRLVRTNFVLDWPATPTSGRAGSGSSTRARAPTRCIATSAFGNRGRVHARDPEQLQRHMDCRRLISNVIVYWNTRYIAHALETLECHGHNLRDEDIRHIHPVHFEHINPPRTGRRPLNTQQLRLQITRFTRDTKPDARGPIAHRAIGPCASVGPHKALGGCGTLRVAPRFGVRRDQAARACVEGAKRSQNEEAI